MSIKDNEPNNPYGISYDKAGFCVLCHIQIAEFNGSNANGTFVITKLRPNVRAMKLEMSNGSTLSIVICKECEENLDVKDIPAIMESVIEGWEWEIDNLMPHWSKTKKQEHIDSTKKLHITNRKDKPWSKEETKKIKKHKYLKKGNK